MTFKEIDDKAELLSYGFMANEFCGNLTHENREWRFMGIQAKNRAEWSLVHLANMHFNITTVAFYDTLGPEATRFICNQTELTTMAVSVDYVKKLAQMKIADATEPSPLMHRLKNLVVFEEVPEEDHKIAVEAGLNVKTLS